MKQYLKKSDKKSFKKNMERVSLVYGNLSAKISIFLEGSEAATGETIAVGNFDKYFDELSANNNQLFRQQFDVCPQKSEIKFAPFPIFSNDDSRFIVLHPPYSQIELNRLPIRAN